MLFTHVTRYDVYVVAMPRSALRRYDARWLVMRYSAMLSAIAGARGMAARRRYESGAVRMQDDAALLRSARYDAYTARYARYALR